MKAAPNGSKEARPSRGARLALLAIQFYRMNLSFLFGGSCRFQPTCSQYTYEAIERFGVRRGAWLGVKRLLRCHPFSRKFGFDPVPESWEEMKMSQRAATQHGEVHS